jgi:excisionase family DNA binding protein
MNETPLLIPVRRAALLLSYNPRTIRRLVDRGELHAVGQGRLIRITMASILAYQARHRGSQPTA